MSPRRPRSRHALLCARTAGPVEIGSHTRLSSWHFSPGRSRAGSTAAWPRRRDVWRPLLLTWARMTPSSPGCLPRGRAPSPNPPQGSSTWLARLPTALTRGPWCDPLPGRRAPWLDWGRVTTQASWWPAAAGWPSSTVTARRSAARSSARLRADTDPSWPRWPWPRQPMGRRVGCSGGVSAGARRPSPSVRSDPCATTSSPARWRHCGTTRGVSRSPGPRQRSPRSSSRSSARRPDSRTRSAGCRGAPRAIVSPGTVAWTSTGWSPRRERPPSSSFSRSRETSTRWS